MCQCGRGGRILVEPLDYCSYVAALWRQGPDVTGWVTATLCWTRAWPSNGSSFGCLSLRRCQHSIESIDTDKLKNVVGCKQPYDLRPVEEQPVLRSASELLPRIGMTLEEAQNMEQAPVDVQQLMVLDDDDDEERSGQRSESQALSRDFGPAYAVGGASCPCASNALQGQLRGETKTSLQRRVSSPCASLALLVSRSCRKSQVDRVVPTGLLSETMAQRNHCPSTSTKEVMDLCSKTWALVTSPTGTWLAHHSHG